MKTLKLLCTGAVLLSLNAGATVRYVDNKAGANSGDGTVRPGWKTLTYAVANAVEGDEIVLLKGTQAFGGNVTVDKRLTIRGEAAAEDTVIDDNYYGRNFTISAAGVLICNLTFTRIGGGYANSPVKVDADSVVSNVVFTGTDGGDNATTLMRLTAGRATCCRVTDNSVGCNPGFAITGPAVVENCVFMRNTQSKTWSNCQNGIIYLGHDGAVVRNCTLTDNILPGVGAIYINKVSGAKVYNCILYNNATSAGVLKNWYSDGITVAQAKIVKCCLSPLTGLDENNGNFDDDPRLMFDRMRIESNSPCRDTARTGTDGDGVAYASSADMDGRTRSATPSVGAFEYVPVADLPMSLKAAGQEKTLVYPPATIRVTCTVGGYYTEPVSYAWDFNNDGTVDATTATAEISASGTYVNPSVVATDADGKKASAFAEGTFTVVTMSDETYYVDYANGDNAAEGSEAAPWKTIAHAVASAAHGDTIVLKRGTHVISANLTVDKAVTIRGEGTAEETIVTMNGNGYFVYVTAEAALIHSLTFSRCGGDWTVRMFQLTGESTFSNVVWTACGSSGGGNYFLLSAEKGLLSCCYFTNNICYDNAGIEIKGSAVVENCVFAKNETTRGNTKGQIIQLVKENNNCAIVRNCTIVDNILAGSSGAVCSEAYSSSCKSKLYNNIIWNNTRVGTGAVQNWSVGSSDANIVARWKNNCTTPLTGLPDDNGNFNGDPKFLSDGLCIGADSSCRGTGLSGLDPEGLPYSTSADVTGLSRSDPPSVGAFEYVPPQEMILTPADVPTMVHLPNVLRFSVSVDGPHTLPLSYAWDFNGDGVIDSTEAEPEIATPGVYPHPTVTVTDHDGKHQSAVFPKTYCLHPAGGVTFYVDYENGDDTNDGSRVDAAFKTLDAALDYPGVDGGDTLLLARGVHELTNKTLEVLKPVTIRGAGTRDETQVRAMSGAHRHLVLKADHVFLCDLTFCKFNTSWQTDAVQMPSDSVISNVVFTGFGLPGDTIGRPLDASAGLVTGCVFTNNLGMLTAGMRATGKVVVENCLFAYNDNSQDSIYGGGIVVVDGSPTLRNCTIVSNRTIGTYCALIGAAGSKVYNSILWGNVSATNAALVCDWSGDASKTVDWRGNCTPRAAEIVGADNIAEDPLFKNGDPIRLTPRSPCRNAGLNEFGPHGGVDVLGKPRLYGRRIDIGAVELQQGMGMSLIIR